MADNALANMLLRQYYGEPETALHDPAIDARGHYPWPTGFDKPVVPPQEARNAGRPDDPFVRGAREYVGSDAVARGSYGLGQVLAETYGKGREGDLTGALENAPLLAAAALPVPGAKRMPATRIENPIQVYHGSPHNFEKFDASKIGTGEGAAAYGHGLYFAENPKVALEYRKNLSKQSSSPYMEYTVRTPYGGELKIPSDRSGYTGTTEGLNEHIAPELHHAVNLIYWDGPAKAKAFTKQWLNDAYEGKGIYPDRGPEYYQKLYDYVRQIKKPDISVSKGRTYEAALHARPEEFLEWNSPLSKQSDQVREALGQAPIDMSRERARLAELEAMRPFNNSRAHERASEEAIRLMEAISDGDPKGASIYRRLVEGFERPLIAPLEAERDALIARYNEHGNLVGARSKMSPEDRQKEWDITDQIIRQRGKGEPAAADALYEAGIPGIRYWDQKSRSRKSGTSNYVVVPKAEEIVELLKRYGVAAPVAGATLADILSQPSPTSQ